MITEIEKDNIFASNEMIESGSYFIEGQKWYNEMFLSTFSIRLLYLIFAVLYIFGVCLAVRFAINLFPLRETKQIVIKTSREADTFINKVNLKGFDTPSKNILAFALSHYVMQRESYIYDEPTAIETMQKKMKFIRQHSSQKMFIQFKEEISDPNSKASMFSNYGVQIKITITNVEFLYDDESVFSYIISKIIPAQVPLSARVEFVANGDHKVATISYSFELPDNKAKGKDAELSLNVSDYSVIRIN